MKAMQGIPPAIPRGFRKLIQFSGRDTQAEFWPYGLVALFLSFIAIRGPTTFFSLYGFMPAGLFITLTAAAVTRRLHDCGRSGRWALFPVLFGSLGLSGFALLPWNRANDLLPNTQYILLLSVNFWLFAASLTALIVLLAQPGTPGTNRYGAALTIVDAPRPVDDRSTPN